MPPAYHDGQGPTLASVWQAETGLAITDEILEWPPDLFALTHVILERSQAYRFAMSPGGQLVWPPGQRITWSDSVLAAGRQWSRRVGGEGRAPDFLLDEWSILSERAHAPLEQLATGREPRLGEAVLTLHAIADEACAGLGGALDASDGHGCTYRARGRELLARMGSLARIPPHRIRVLPKSRTPPNGTSLASLSRYVGAQRSEVDVHWHKVPARRRGSDPWVEHVNFLLLPWPLRVRESDFRPVEGSVQHLANELFGLFEFTLSEPLDLDLVERILVAARDEVDNVDSVVLPESAVDERDVAGLEALLDRHGVAVLHTGVRQRATELGRPAGNWVHTGVSPSLQKGESVPGPTGETWFHIRQNKHNRWLLDERQIHQYHLGGALHPHIRWWEAMDVPRRSLNVMQFGEPTLITLVCEDLAQNDGVAEVVRSVGPTVVMTPLLDGPQLPSRWAARYASVFADHPGSAVLTVTSHGMAQRSRPRGREASPIVALWKDPVRGAREIPLEPGAQAVLLTACAARTIRRTRDGRLPVDNGIDFFDVGVHQVRAASAGSGSTSSQFQARPPQPLGVEEVTILTSWAEALAEALVSAPDCLEAVLADARTGAPWRAALGIAEPSAQLNEAIETMSHAVRAAAVTDPVPTAEALMVALRDVPPGERGPHGLSRRVLRSTLDARLTDLIGR
jgi:hypothetical protein